MENPVTSLTEKKILKINTRGVNTYHQKLPGDLTYLRLCPLFVEGEICKRAEGVEGPLAPN